MPSIKAYNTKMDSREHTRVISSSYRRKSPPGKLKKEFKSPVKNVFNLQLIFHLNTLTKVRQVIVSKSSTFATVPQHAQSQGDLDIERGGTSTTYNPEKLKHDCFEDQAEKPTATESSIDQDVVNFPDPEQLVRILHDYSISSNGQDLPPVSLDADSAQEPNDSGPKKGSEISRNGVGGDGGRGSTPSGNSGKGNGDGKDKKNESYEPFENTAISEDSDEESNEEVQAEEDSTGRTAPGIIMRADHGDREDLQDDNASGTDRDNAAPERGTRGEGSNSDRTRTRKRAKKVMPVSDQKCPLWERVRMLVDWSISVQPMLAIEWPEINSASREQSSHSFPPQPSISDNLGIATDSNPQLTADSAPSASSSSSSTGVRDHDAAHNTGLLSSKYSLPRDLRSQVLHRKQLEDKIQRKRKRLRRVQSYGRLCSHSRPRRSRYRASVWTHDSNGNHETAGVHGQCFEDLLRRSGDTVSLQLPGSQDAGNPPGATNDHAGLHLQFPFVCQFPNSPLNIRRGVSLWAQCEQDSEENNQDGRLRYGEIQLRLGIILMENDNYENTEYEEDIIIDLHSRPQPQERPGLELLGAPEYAQDIRPIHSPSASEEGDPRCEFCEVERSDMALHPCGCHLCNRCSLRYLGEWRMIGRFSRDPCPVCGQEVQRAFEFARRG